ncbi:hypothetical protein ACSW8Q_16000 (plasmid) [Clostridium perfringens]|uniref:hypothetical protein n=1 Tax=Clostridium perfringens TaxID=1502 RepID=UPI0024BC1C1A|nr:hypothetical protein [Clostridium perfringens]WVM62194.1 hypothetical protein V1657_15415 [Clostridium perfringens]
MFNELKRIINRAENDIKLFQDLLKKITNTLDKKHETKLSNAIEYQDINVNQLLYLVITKIVSP